jgi:hypothetical protein
LCEKKTPAGEAGAFAGTSEGKNSIVQEISNSITEWSSRLITFLAQTGGLRRGNRLDQARIVIPDIADVRADRPADHVVADADGGSKRILPSRQTAGAEFSEYAGK